MGHRSLVPPEDIFGLHLGPLWVQNGPKLGQNGPKQHLWGLGAPKWLEQGGTRLERGIANWD